MNKHTTGKQLPLTPSIMGTQVHCSVLGSTPLTNYFDISTVYTLATIYAHLSSFSGRRIPDERSVVAGVDQQKGAPCRPMSACLLAIGPNINEDSIVFEGGRMITASDLIFLFQYLTCGLGVIGLDLRPGEQASDGVRSGAALLFNDMLGPDIIRIDKLVSWALRVRHASITSEDCRPVFQEHSLRVQAAIQSGLYRVIEYSPQPSAPVTPEDFEALAAGTFFLNPSATAPLPPPVLDSIPFTPGKKLLPLGGVGNELGEQIHHGKQIGAIKAPYMVNPGCAVLGGVGVGAIDPSTKESFARLQGRQVHPLLNRDPGMPLAPTEGPLPNQQSGHIPAKEFSAHGGDHTRGHSQEQGNCSSVEQIPRGTIGTVAGEAMVFENIREFENHTEGMSQRKFAAQLRTPENYGGLLAKMGQLRFVYVGSEGKLFCHLYTLMPLFSDKKGFRPHLLLRDIKNIQGESGKGLVVETADIGNAKSALFDLEMLMWMAGREGKGVSRNAAEAIRGIAARMEDLSTVMAAPGRVVSYWSSEHCRCLQYFSTCGCSQAEQEPDVEIPEALQFTTDDYIQHANGRIAEALAQAKGDFEAAVQVARSGLASSLAHIMNGLHQAIDPEDFAKHQEEELEDYSLE